MECQFCKKTLCSKYSLINHQKRSKKCLDIQGKKLEETFTCDSCNKIFSEKLHIKRHLMICKKNNMNIHEKK